jgi:hypothetical protein
MSDASDFGGVLLDFSEVSLDDLGTLDHFVIERELRNLITSESDDDVVAGFTSYVDGT